MRQILGQKLLLSLIAASATLSAAVPAFAGHEDNYEDRARVTSVTPQFERVNTPRQECRTEYVRESVYEAPSRSPGGAILGGVSGGLLGSLIGKGKGRVAAAAVGAGIGAVVGDRMDNSDQRRGREQIVTRPVESCVTVDNWSQVPTGYLVSYEYNGRQYSTVTNQDPGRFIPVNVQVRPNGYVQQVAYSQGRDDDRYERDEPRGRGHHGVQRERRYW